MKRFTIPCNFGGTRAPFHIYIGEPAGAWHPLFFQSIWLQQERGGDVPPEVMESFGKLQGIAKENNVSFEELCVYALGTANASTRPAIEAPVEPVVEATDDKEKKAPEPRISALANPETLHTVLEEDFYLLGVICRNRESQFCRAVVLVREVNVQPLVRAVLTDNWPVETLGRFGRVEYAAVGAEFDPNDSNLYRVLVKYELVSKG
jgi:hypothetical protein